MEVLSELGGRGGGCGIYMSGLRVGVDMKKEKAEEVMSGEVIVR